jgi:hypothetical protein
MTKELLRFKLQWSMNIYGYVAINWKRHGFLMQKNIIILADGIMHGSCKRTFFLQGGRIKNYNILLHPFQITVIILTTV